MTRTRLPQRALPLQRNMPLTHLIIRTRDLNAPAANGAVRHKPQAVVDHICYTVADFNQERARAELTALGASNVRDAGATTASMAAIRSATRSRSPASPRPPSAAAVDAGGPLKRDGFRSNRHRAFSHSQNWMWSSPHTAAPTGARAPPKGLGPSLDMVAHDTLQDRATSACVSRCWRRRIDQSSPDRDIPIGASVTAITSPQPRTCH